MRHAEDAGMQRRQTACLKGSMHEGIDMNADDGRHRGWKKREAKTKKEEC